MKVLLLALAAVAFLAAPSVGCPSGWISFNSVCYGYFSQRETFDDAERACQQADSQAHLVSIHSQAENDFVYAMFRINAGNTPRWIYDWSARYPMTGVWIGLHQETRDGPWVNVDGTSADYIPWEENEPNDSYYAESEEDCVVLWRTNVLADTTRQWNDMTCDQETFPFICKLVERNVRLVDGEDDNEGRVEVYHDGHWGTVCDDAFDDTDAGVVCQSLGIGSSGTAFPEAFFGEGSDPIWLDDVACSGSENSLFDCEARTIGSNNCGHSEDVGVRCTPSARTVRLVGGLSLSEGRVEVKHDGIWGTVCDDSWDDIDAGVVCRSLGLGSSGVARSMAYFGEGSGSIWLDNVECSGSENSLFDCTSNDIGDHNCGHSEDAGVSCS